MTATDTSFTLNVKIQHPDASWMDVTANVMVRNSIRASWGIGGNGPLDRIAQTGVKSFTLKDKDHALYDAIGTAASTGWGINSLCDMIFTYQSVQYLRFRGFIASIDPVPQVNGMFSLDITVFDWMDYPARHPIVSPLIESNKRANDVIYDLAALIPSIPGYTDLDEGTAIYPAVYDTTRARSTVLAEMSKAVYSELGYLYLKHDKTLATTLTFENRQRRDGMRIASSFPTSAHMLNEDGGFLLDENGNRMLSEGGQTFDLADESSEIDLKYGDNIINRATLRAYPRTISTSAQVLYALGSPIQIGSLETKTIHASYTDPNGGGARVNAIDSTMIAPVATTDYLMNSKSDGTGTNLTANLTVTATYASNGVDYVLVSDYGGVAYITKLQARGYAVFIYDAIEAIEESDASANAYGWSEVSVNQPYQQDTVFGILEAQKIVNARKNPRLEINRITFVANRSPDLMNAFLNLDIGDRVIINHTASGFNRLCYIHGVEMVIEGGKVIKFTWILSAVLTIALGLSPIGMEFEAGSTQVVEFGYLPQLVNKNERSIAVRIYQQTETANHLEVITGAYSANAGWFLYTSYQAVGFYQEAPTTAGAWFSHDTVVPLNDWVDIVVTRDCSSADNLPKMYIDGVEVTVDESLHAGGDILDETGAILRIGNTDSAVHPLDIPFDGIIQDVRYFNRILTAAEALQIHNNHNVQLTDTLFEAPYVHTADLAVYTDLTLTTEDKIIDGVFGMVGTAKNGPIARVP